MSVISIYIHQTAISCIFIHLPCLSSVSLTMYLSVGVLAALPALLTAIPMSECVEGEGSLYDFELELLDRSRNVSLSEYEGKVVMLVNTATY